MNKLIARLLNEVAGTLIDHGYNDLPRDFWSDITDNEKKEIIKKVHEWNGDPSEDYEPEDYMLAQFFAETLENKSCKNCEFWDKGYCKQFMENDDVTAIIDDAFSEVESYSTKETFCCNNFEVKK